MAEFHSLVCASQTEQLSPELLIVYIPVEETLIKTLIKLPKSLFVIRSHRRLHTSGASQVRVCLSGWMQWRLVTQMGVACCCGCTGDFNLTFFPNNVNVQVTPCDFLFVLLHWLFILHSLLIR